MHPRLSLALLALSATAVAQTQVVSPRPFATLPAPSGNTHPLGPTLTTSPSMRYQSIHDDMQGQPGLIRGLSLRMNEGTTSSVAANLVMEVRISTAASLAAAAVTTFDTNHGTDRVTVVPASSPFSFPVVPPVTPGPTPFAFVVPFNTNFAFAGSLGIAWEMLIASRSNASSFSLDAASASAFTLVGVNFGSGCIATGRTAAASASSSYSTATSTLTLTAANTTASALGALVLGTNTTTWGGIPLPFDIPNTTGYSSGTCRVYSDWALSVPLTASAAGALSVGVPLTLGPATLGAKFFHYGLTLDATANGFGLITTNARMTGLGDGAVLGGCRVYVHDVTQAAGTKDSTIVVTQFTY